MSRSAREADERRREWSDGGWSGPRRVPPGPWMVWHTTRGGKGAVARLLAASKRKPAERKP